MTFCFARGESRAEKRDSPFCGASRGWWVEVFKEPGGLTATNSGQAVVALIKDVIRPGVFRKGSEEFFVSEADIAAWVDGFRKMREEKLAVPVPWEHPGQDDPEYRPLTEKDKARLATKLNAGFVEDLRIAEDGTLQAVLDVTDEDAARLESVGTFVSPNFGKFKDSSGRWWDKAISHIALTTKPVNVEQTRKFSRVNVSELNRTVSFSMADKVDMKTKDDAPADDKDKGLILPGQEGDAETMKALIGQFAAMGIVLPTTIKLSGDLNVLLAAVATAGKAKSEGKAMGDAAKVPGKPVEEKPATVQMSREEFEKVTAMSQSVADLQAQNESLIAELTASKKAALLGRINVAFDSGRCTKPRADKLREAAGTYAFSREPSEVERALELIEEMPAGACWSDEEKTAAFSSEGVREVKPSGFYKSQLDDEEAEKLIAQLAGR